MLENLTLNQIRSGLDEKKFSATELASYYLARIIKHQDLKAYITVTEELALEQAAVADQKISRGQTSPLLGVPLGIKDVIMTEGIRTTAGSKILDNYIPPYDATIVQQLKMLGAVILGKTNCDEFAMGSSNENSAYGPCLNPHDKSRVPGGSSGGSACAVAADLCAVGLGTDTGGSIRQPAAFCGITGLRPTYGSISRYGLAAMTSSLDQAGFFTRSAEDLAICFNAFIGQDKNDQTSFKVSKVQENIITKRFKIGLPQECFGAGLDPEIEEKVRSAMEVFKSLGHEIVEIKLPLADYALAVYYVLASAEISSNLARFDGVRYGQRFEQETLEQTYLATRTAGLGPEAKRRIIMGTFVLSSGYQEAFYNKAKAVQEKIRREYLKAFQSVDLLLTPTTPTTAFKIAAKVSDPLAMYLSDIYTVSTNIANLCALSIPAGFSSSLGLPIGLQLISGPGHDGDIIQAAMQYQSLTSWHKQLPEL